MTHFPYPTNLAKSWTKSINQSPNIMAWRSSLTRFWLTKLPNFTVNNILIYSLGLVASIVLNPTKFYIFFGLVSFAIKFSDDLMIMCPILHFYPTKWQSYPLSSSPQASALCTLGHTPIPPSYGSHNNCTVAIIRPYICLLY